MGFENFLGLVRPEQAAGPALASASIIYLLLAFWRVAQYRPPPAGSSSFHPPISVLKPLCGAEPGLYRCLRSFCAQEYPTFQLVFGVSNAGDPAIAVVHRLMAEFPARDLALVVDPGLARTNLKLSNLVNMYRAAKHDIIVVSDSDTLVQPDCLAEVVAPLADPKTGAVTCLYRAAPLPGLASRAGRSLHQRLGALLGLGPELMLALSLMKRGRELILGALGLGLWHALEAQHLWCRARAAGGD